MTVYDGWARIISTCSRFHWPDPDVLTFEDTMVVMQELVAANQVRHVGICNYAGEQVRRAHAAMPALATLQSPYAHAAPRPGDRDVSLLTFSTASASSRIGRWSQGTALAERQPQEGAPSALRAQATVVARLRPIAERAWDDRWPNLRWPGCSHDPVSPRSSRAPRSITSLLRMSRCSRLEPCSVGGPGDRPRPRRIRLSAG